MNSPEREQFKESLTGLAGHGAGLDLDTPNQWVVEGVTQAELFFTHLNRLLPADAVLYFEGCTIAPEVTAFYERYRAKDALPVVRDTIYPVPDVYHVTFSPDVIAHLRELAAKRPLEELFYHLKAYQGESLIFTFHDAFTGELRISERLDEPAVADFCRLFGATYRREPTLKRDPAQLQALLNALENPSRIRFANDP